MVSLSGRTHAEGAGLDPVVGRDFNEGRGREGGIAGATETLAEAAAGNVVGRCRNAAGEGEKR